MIEWKGVVKKDWLNSRKLATEDFGISFYFSF